jgi:large subunit ribosomal protein L10
MRRWIAVTNSNRQLKEVKVAEIKEKLEKAQAVVLTKYQGLTVEEDTQLRKNLREAGVEYRVYKNTLTTLAAKELGLDGIVEFLEGPVSIAFGYDDVTAPARILNDFAKDHKALELKAGVVDGELYDSEQIKQLATIPSKEVLIAKLLGSIKSPISSFARVISAIADSKGNETAE